jgi:ketosteroid isomerase-like protein
MTMKTRDLAVAVTEMLKAGDHDGAAARFHADDVVSIEDMDGPMARLEGRAAVLEKARWWYDNHEVHSAETEGPWIHGDQFIVRFSMDITRKADGERLSMTETGLYTVRGGKIVEERFFY